MTNDIERFVVIWMTSDDVEQVASILSLSTLAVIRKSEYLIRRGVKLKPLTRDGRPIQRRRRHPCGNSKYSDEYIENFRSAWNSSQTLDEASQKLGITGVDARKIGYYLRHFRKVELKKFSAVYHTVYTDEYMENFRSVWESSSTLEEAASRLGLSNKNSQRLARRFRNSKFPTLKRMRAENSSLALKRERDAKIVKLRLIDGVSVSDICDTLGLTKEVVYRVLDAAPAFASSCDGWVPPWEESCGQVEPWE